MAFVFFLNLFCLKVDDSALPHLQLLLSGCEKFHALYLESLLNSVRGSSNSKLTWIMWQHLGLIFHCGICMPQCVTGNVVFHKTAILEFRGALNFVYILEDALMNAFVDMSSWMQKCKSVHLCFLLVFFKRSVRSKELLSAGSFVSASLFVLS